MLFFLQKCFICFAEMFYMKIFIHEEEVATASCVALSKQKSCCHFVWVFREILVRRLRQKFWIIYYMFYISSCHASPTARQNNMLTPQEKKNNIETYRTKQLIWLNSISWTECYLLTCTNSCTLFPLLSMLSAQKRSACCLLNEYDDNDYYYRYYS